MSVGSGKQRADQAADVSQTDASLKKGNLPGKCKQACARAAEQMYRLSAYTGLTCMKLFKRIRRDLSILFIRGKKYTCAHLDKSLERFKARCSRLSRLTSVPYHKQKEKTLQSFSNLRQTYTESKWEFTKVIGKGFGRFCLGLGKFCFSSLNYLGPVAAALFLIATISHYNSLTYAVVVEYGGEELGLVADESVFDDAEKMMQERIIYEEGAERVKAIPKFTLTQVDAVSELITADAVCDKLIESSGAKISEANGLYINGKFMGATLDGESLEECLDEQLQKYATGKGNEEISFIDDVEIKEGIYPISSIVASAKLENLVTREVSGDVYYTVVTGDSPSLIADKTEVPLNDLRALNEDLEEKMYPGEEILVAKSKPFLGVQVVSQIQYTEEIPYEVKEIKDDAYYEGYESVEVEGENGIKTITAKVVMVDGVETDRKIISSKVTKEAVDEQIIVGEKVQAASAPASRNAPSAYSAANTNSVRAVASSGGFLWPVDGGYMSCRIWGYSGHTGMDIAAKYGTTVRASQSGVVEVAKTYGWNGGYGNYVLINHGNGVKTLYAHNSAVYVRPGQTVRQGDAIAAVGASGNAYGNHCHFELRINGQFIDPGIYIGYSY